VKKIPHCSIHEIPLVCPSCEARERGRRGGLSRAKRAANDSKIAAAGTKGGRKKRKQLAPPASLVTPLIE
jgi:hypothetical protein